MGFAGFFIVVVAACAMSLLALYVFLALYVYHDAKTHADNPTLWLLIALLVPSFFGFIVYFLVGRTKKAPSDHRYRVAAIICAVLVAASGVLFGVMMVSSGELPILDNVSIGMVSDNIGSHWNVSYKTSGETLERTLNLTDEEMAAFTAAGSCAEGRVYMLMVQGENVLHVELTEREKMPLDLSMFDAGKIHVSLYNEGAREVEVRLEW